MLIFWLAAGRVLCFLEIKVSETARENNVWMSVVAGHSSETSEHCEKKIVK